MCGSGLVGMCVAHPSGMGSPAVIPSQGPSMAQMAKPPAEEDPFMRPDKEEEEVCTSKFVWISCSDSSAIRTAAVYHPCVDGDIHSSIGCWLLPSVSQ